MVTLREVAVANGLCVLHSIRGFVRHAVGERAGLCRPTS